MLNALWWIVPVVVIVAVAVLLRRTFVMVNVTGESMEPTLREGDRVLVRRVRLAAVPAGGLVVFALPVMGPHGAVHWTEKTPGGPRWMVKRATGVPGDALPADYTGPDPGDSFPTGDAFSTDATSAGTDNGPGTVPAGTLFVLGDNPASSTDSREIGCVPASHLLGLVVRRL